MSEPPSRIRDRRPAAETLVAAVVGVLILVILLQLSVSRCSSSRDGNRSAAPGSTRSTATHPAVPGGSSPARTTPSPSAGAQRSAGPTGTASTGAGGPRSEDPSAAAPGTAGTATSVPTASGSAQPVTGPTPSGAPRTGGGGGRGMRNPMLVVAGILLLFAGAALVLFRARPPIWGPDDSGVA